MKRVLFITRHYLSDNNGGANATKGFVHAFAKLYDDLWVIYPEHDGEESCSYVPASCRLLPCYDHRSKIQKGLDVYRGRLHRLTDFVRNHLRKNGKYDIIVLDHSVTAASILKDVIATGSKVVTIHHNVERDYLKDNMPPLAYRFPMLYYSKKAERNALLNSDLNLTLTKKDSETFKSWFPDKNLHLCDVGICEYRGLPERTFDDKERKSNFIISGSLCFQQSLEPIIDFVRIYYPVLKDVCPEATLTIAGRNPSGLLYEACKPYGDIHIVPNPEDMSEVVWKSDVYICPISAGSGIKLRLMDGLKEGKPVICHHVSTYGYEALVKAGVICEYADTESFKNALCAMLNRHRNPVEDYQLFCDCFSVDKLALRIDKAICQMSAEEK